jgi:16S rRNA (cytosine967-C5)-methyltransferase
MKPEVRRCALEGLGAVLEQGVALRDWMNGPLAEALSGHERAQAHDLLTGTVRWLSRLDRHLAHLAKRPPEPWVRDLARLALYQLEVGTRVPPHAVVSETVELARRERGRGVAGWLNAVLRNHLRQRGTVDLFQGPGGEAAALAMPEWLLHSLARAYGNLGARRVAAGLNRAAALDLRVNLSRGSREALMERLQAAGHRVEPIQGSASGVHVEPGPGLFDQPGWLAGEWVVQDRNSAAVADLLGERLRGVVLDACSGSGIKLLGWCGRPGIGGLVALDRSARRLREGRELLARWGADPGVEVAHVAADAAHPGLERGAFDAVVVDAPCSGTGTIRRRPEIKWRVTPQAVIQLALAQGAILEGVAPLVKPGGLLAYVVCSLLPEEGEGVVGEFLKRHQEFHALEPGPGRQPGAVAPGGVARLFDPDSPGDGFLVALLQRGRGQAGPSVLQLGT